MRASGLLQRKGRSGASLSSRKTSPSRSKGTSIIFKTCMDSQAAAIPCRHHFAGAHDAPLVALLDNRRYWGRVSAAWMIRLYFR
jgi:hypothetical protein